MPEPLLELRLGNASATEALGAALARAYPRDEPGSGMLHLHGELGAGKTTCVRSLLRALGAAGLIRSPTYTLVEVYEFTGLSCIHVDLYRLRGTLDVEELGLRDYLNDHCLFLVEWPEKGAAALPVADIDLTLTYAGDSRACRLEGRTARGRSWMAKLGLDTSLAPYVSNLT